MEKITQYLIQSTVHGSEVRAWEEDIMLPTYEIGKEEKNPIFLEKRVYQGSSGSVYPYPVVEKISGNTSTESGLASFTRTANSCDLSEVSTSQRPDSKPFTV